MQPGETIGRFVVDVRLGGGGMAQVYRAHDPRRPEISIALKVMNTEHIHRPRSVERFAREGMLLCSLRHPNLVQGIANSTAAERPFIAMEYIDGSDLSHVIATRGRLTPSEALGVVLDVARGLDHLLSASGLTAHRDIKPANILITGSGETKLADLGIAKTDEPCESLTMTSSFLGSPHYMAPEQILDPRTADVRADLYALGAVLFEAVTGSKAFPGVSTKEVLDAHFGVPVPSIGATDPDGLLCDAVLRVTLCEDPADRVGTPAELITLIESGEAPAPRAHRRRTTTRTAAAAGCVLLVLTSVALLNGPTSRPTPTDDAVPETAREPSVESTGAPAAPSAPPTAQTAPNRSGPAIGTRMTDGIGAAADRAAAQALGLSTER